MHNFIDDQDDLTRTDNDYTWYRLLPFEDRQRAHRHATELLEAYTQILNVTAEQVSALITVSGNLGKTKDFRLDAEATRNSTELALYLSLANRLETRWAELSAFVTTIQDDLAWLDNVIQVPNSVHDSHAELGCFSCGIASLAGELRRFWYQYRGAGERANHQAWVKLCEICGRPSRRDARAGLFQRFLIKSGYLLKPDTDVATSPVRLKKKSREPRTNHAEPGWFLLGAEPGDLIEVTGGGDYDENGSWCPATIRAADLVTVETLDLSANSSTQ